MARLSKTDGEPLLTWGSRGDLVSSASTAQRQSRAPAGIAAIQTSALGHFGSRPRRFAAWTAPTTVVAAA